MDSSNCLLRTRSASAKAYLSAQGSLADGIRGPADWIRPGTGSAASPCLHLVSSQRIVTNPVCFSDSAWRYGVCRRENRLRVRHTKFREAECQGAALDCHAVLSIT